jgi:hypothetical protein
MQKRIWRHVLDNPAVPAYRRNLSTIGAIRLRAACIVYLRRNIPWNLILIKFP